MNGIDTRIAEYNNFFTAVAIIGNQQAEDPTDDPPEDLPADVPEDPPDTQGQHQAGHLPLQPGEQPHQLAHPLQPPTTINGKETRKSRRNGTNVDYSIFFD